MPTEIHWIWARDADYRETISRIKRDERNRVLRLPSPPSMPMLGVISYRLMTQFDRCPEPIVFAEEELDVVFLKEAEQFLARHCGIDLDRSVLVERSYFVMRDKTGFRVRYPVVQFWDYGVLGATVASEWNLDDAYYVDRLLMKTELQHACDLE